MNRAKHIQQSFRFVLTVFFLGFFFAVDPAIAIDSTKTQIDIDTGLGKPIYLMKGKLAKLHSSKPITRQQVIDPAIAEIHATEDQSAKYVFVKGMTFGTTQLNLWGKDDELIGAFEIVVRPDTTELKKGLHEIFPAENVSVKESGGDYLTLTGTVSSSDMLTKILKYTETYAPPEKVINLLQVGGIQQVMLEVRIAEISKSAGDRLGVNFAWAGANAFGVSLLSNLINADGWPVDTSVTVGSSINAVLGFHSGDPVILAIDALQEDGLLKILARPTLIAQSGQNASFLAGGEFPFPIAQSLGAFSIEWKPFGIGLNFTPTVLGNDTISLVVSPEVSELDFTKTVSFGGFIVPAIDTRRMSTVVELKDNQSFAIAGLLKNYVRESVKKFPLLGDIPILGALFRSSSFQKDETELVVIVTPHLVRPSDAGTLPLPTDSFEEPTPFEFLMLGMFEKYHGRNRQDIDISGNEGSTPAMEGNYGYIIPE